MSQHLHTYGWKPDLPDQRDRYYAITPPQVLPEKVDLRPYCSAVENQGGLGSCTAHALTSALEYLEIKDNLAEVQMSRLFLYYNERAREQTIDQDSGAMLRTGIKVLVKLGCCTEDKWPYVETKFRMQPTENCYTQAMDHQVLDYQRIITLTQMKQCLASGFPFVFGFMVYESFEATRVAQTGVVNMPQMEEQALGGHAVLAVGYDNNEERILVKNSWGSHWGMEGYFTMPYRYVIDRNLSDDFWTIKRVERSVITPPFEPASSETSGTLRILSQSSPSDSYDA